ncbi:MAG TPA: haloacid dehalogenase [Chloroflexota bacterium]|nr:haloacid dehalogenase [Chloroflexota bacterium]
MELEQLGEQVREAFQGRHAARERGLALHRDVIRGSANSIRAAHRGDNERARELLAEAQRLLGEIEAALSPYPEIYYAGFVHDCQKELAEASITLALLNDLPLPPPSDLKVKLPAYLNGLAEAIGEVRRHVLDQVRRGALDRCEPLLQRMDDIYSLLVTIDYPDAITGGLRRSTDVARSILEKTRGDLTVAMRQQDLEQALRSMERKLGAS